MDQAMMTALLRHLLQMLGGALVAQGVLDAAMLQTAVGAVVSLATVGWYLAAKPRGSK